MFQKYNFSYVEHFEIDSKISKSAIYHIWFSDALSALNKIVKILSTFNYHILSTINIILSKYFCLNRERPFTT